VYTLPDGRGFTVDGIYFTSAMSSMWALGTKHTLSTDKEQYKGDAKTIFTFTGWQYAEGVLSSNNIVSVSADVATREFWATFDTKHALSLNFSNCPDTTCQVGTVYVGDTPYTSDTDIFLASGSQVRLRAEPAPGYVFMGWEAGQNQQIAGQFDTVTMNTPTVVRPRFLLARKIRLMTSPEELDVYSDRSRIATPAIVEWAYGSTHTLGVPSPQMSFKDGKWWIFSKWDDGAPENRTYTVEPGGEIKTFTAVFVPGTATDLRTLPVGLTLKVDGRDNWTSYIFPWGAGEVHRLEAPETQTDASGKLWQFSAWTNGGPRVQDYTVPAGQMSETVRVTAVYTPVARLTVESAVSGLTVKVDGAECATPCEVRKPVGTVVKVWAPASLPMGDQSRADFEGWPGSGSTASEWSLTLGADPVNEYLTYRTMHRLSVSSDPADGATWRLAPGSSDGFYEAGVAVTVTAVTQPGFRFRRWAGDASGSAPATTVAMSAPRTVEAMLERIPYIAPAGVASAAGLPAEAGVAPGSIVSVFGASFTTDTAAGPDNPLAQAIGCVTVRSGGRLMPLFFASPGQINFQLPDDTPVGEQKLVVSCQGMPDVEGTFRVVRSAPGLFDGALFHEDGSLVTGDAPAKTGELVTAYGTGFGPAVARRPFGLAPLEESAIVDGVTVQVGDVTVVAEKVVAAAGKVGVDAVAFRWPEGGGKVSVK
jgi:uncharacterized protein (TIGR03437 family)